MKLLTKYNRINLLATIVVLLFSSGCYYFMIHSVLLHQLDKDLKIEEHEINDYIKLNNSLPNPTNYKDQQVAFELTRDTMLKRKFSSGNKYNKKEHEYIATRQLIFPATVAGQRYAVLITKSQEETEDLITMILAITFGVVTLLLLTLFLVNRFFLHKLWQPFYSTLNQLSQFNLSNKNSVILQTSSINEFTELNQSVNIMVKQVSKDYETLKTFTESASHEMQTPLAIINSKLDVLIQDDKINENQMHHLQGIYEALDRLSKLNQSLLLLTKIENNQFKQTEKIPLRNLIADKLMQFDEMIAAKKIVVTTLLQPSLIECNKQLADILISNLLHNAIRYNQPGGVINLSLSPHQLKISNTSFLPPLDNQKIFHRFYRHTDTKLEGNGLGLSIIKQICDESGFAISYGFENENHFFKIRF